MNNFEFDKDMFVKEDYKKSILNNIPGYRSNKLIKKIIASMYYLLCILSIFIARNIGELFISLLLIVGFVFACHLADLIFKKEKRELYTIKRHLGLPFFIMTICFFAFGIFGRVFNPQEEAAKELGISLKEYNRVIQEYKDMINDNKSLVDSNKSSKLDYENKQREYDNLLKEFDTYKKSVSEESVKELDNLKTINESYKKQISDLESKISELENKLN